MIKIGSLIDLSPLPKAPSFQWLTRFPSNAANLSDTPWPAHLPFVRFPPEAQRAGLGEAAPPATVVEALLVNSTLGARLGAEPSLCLAQQSLPTTTTFQGGTQRQAADLGAPRETCISRPRGHPPFSAASSSRRQNARETDCAQRGRGPPGVAKQTECRAPLPDSRPHGDGASVGSGLWPRRHCLCPESLEEPPAQGKRLTLAQNTLPTRTPISSTLSHPGLLRPSGQPIPGQLGPRERRASEDGLGVWGICPHLPHSHINIVVTGGC